MSKSIWIQMMIAMTVLLVSAPLMSHAAEPGPAVHQAAGTGLTSGARTALTCTVQHEGTTSAYYRGRVGILEHHVGQRVDGKLGSLICTTPSGDKVKVFRHCQL